MCAGTKIILGLLAWLALRNVCRLHAPRQEHLGNLLLVTAHPDDESMFFSPLLYHCRPTILCLSDGDYGGLGRIRRQELHQLCRSLNIQCKVLNYIDNEPWSKWRIVLDLLSFLRKHRIDTVVTFDERGVSGHHNHISCCRAVRMLEGILPKGALKCRYLKSTSFFRKFVFDLSPKQYTVPIYSQFGFRNMLVHRSQMVWFRYLYCIFSSYMHYNEYTASPYSHVAQQAREERHHT